MSLFIESSTLIVDNPILGELCWTAQAGSSRPIEMAWIDGNDAFFIIAFSIAFS
jgi:hypothetical protein